MSTNIYFQGHLLIIFASTSVSLAGDARIKPRCGPPQVIVGTQYTGSIGTENPASMLTTVL